MTNLRGARPAPYVLTNSRRRELTVCPWREYVRYTLGLQPWVAAEPLSFGTLWHDLMAAVYRLHAWWESAPLGKDEPELSPAEVVQVVLGEAEFDPAPTWDRTCYLATIPGESPRRVVPPGGVLQAWRRRMLAQQRPWQGQTVQVHDPQTVDEMAALAQAMLRGYLERWWSVDRARYRVLAVEHRMQAPVRCPSGHPSWQWLYAGDLDVALLDREGRAVVVIDHKTCSGDPEEEVAAQEVSPQVEGYCWLWTEEHPDMPASTVLYRTTRKKAPSVPERLKCDGGLADGVVVDHSGCVLCGGSGLGPASADGKKQLKCKGKRSDGVAERHDACGKCHGTELGGLSVKACDTSPEVYLAAMAEADAAGFPHSDKHEDILASLRKAWPDRWFGEHRRQLAAPGGDPFARFKRETWRICRAKMEMLRGGEHGHWRADGSAVCTMYGRACSHMPLCRENAPDTLALYRSSQALGDMFEERWLDR